MTSGKSRVSYPALLLAIVVFIAANAHLELSNAAPALPGRPFTVASVPNVHLADKTQYVSDPDGLLEKEAVAAINRDATDLEARLGVELAVVALKNTGENDAREFTTDLFNHWGLGKKGKDNGLLILLVTEPPERSVIFETGYGLEGVLPDAIAFRLQQRYMVPDFKNNDWSKGLAKGVKAVCDYLVAAPEERALLVPQAASPAAARQDDVSPFTVALIIFVFLALAFWAWRDPESFARFLSAVFRGRGGGGRRGGGGWGGGGWGGGGRGGGSWGGGSSGGGGARSRF